MAILSRTILLISIFGCVYAQFPDVDVQPQRTGTASKPRYHRPQLPRTGSQQVQSIIGSTRPRRPIPLSRPRPAPTADTPEYPSFTNARPRPVFSSPLVGKELPNPSASLERQQVKQQQQQPQQQQEPAVKPVSEETEEGEDIAQAIANLGAVSSFPQQSGNLVSGPLTPKPELLGAIQYRGVSSPLSLLARPAPLVEQNIAPIQYRPQKPLKIRKPIIEEVPEVRTTARQQTQSQQNPVRTVQRVSDTREKYSEPREKYSEPREKYSEPRDKYSGTRDKKPVAQIIRRWREDNADGSITWGFENDDGSFKEELIGVDCITRGKYGYIDLDGIRREYSYETGIRCDEDEQEEDKENGFVDYQENKLVLPNGKTIDLSTMGKKQTRRPQPIYRN